MFTYTVYGVANVSGRRTGGRVEPVSGILGVLPVQRSKSLYYGNADQAQQAFGAQKVTQSHIRPRRDPVEPVAAVTPRAKPYTREATDMVIQNIQPLLLEYRRPKIAEDQNIIGKHQDLLDNVMARYNSGAVIWQ